MANKKLFVLVSEKVAFKTMTAVAAHVGKSRVYPKDFEKLGVAEMTEEEFEVLKATPEVPKAVVEGMTKSTDELNKASEVAEENSETEAAGLDKDDILDREYPNKKEEVEEEAAEAEETEEAPETEEEEAEEEEAEEVEETEEEHAPEPEASTEDGEDEAADLTFENIEEFVVVMKGMKGEEVVALATELGLEWKENENKGINRMRASIALREYFFPGVRRPSAPKSPWKKVPYAEIEKLAEENNLTWTKTEDEKINRMWAIHALNEAGITPPAKAEEKEEVKN